MFRRKLEALDYINAQEFNICSDNDFKNLVVWLEDQKIRHYAIENRASLKDTSSPDWNNAFLKYLDDLSCPADRNSIKSVCDWLLSFAVRLEYEDGVEKYSCAPLEKKVDEPAVVQENPLDNMDFESQDFRAGVASLAKILKIIPHPDHLVTLSAICTVVEKYYSQSALQKAQGSKESSGKPFPLEEMSVGFETHDKALEQAAKILRLLYIQDLRSLQTKINEAIVAVQKVTANPKTDTRLGKVGR